MERRPTTQTWLPEYSVDAVRRALALAAPELTGARIDLQARHDYSPRSRRATTVLDGELILKFAWSEPAGEILAREISIISALADLGLPVPTPLLVRWAPVLLLYRRIDGVPFSWDRAATLPLVDRRAFADSLSDVLAALHAPSTLERIRAADVALEAPLAQSDSGRLRSGLLPLLDPEQANWAAGVLDHVDKVLAEPAEATVFLHGDLHGWNLVADPTCRRVVGLLDLEQAGAGDHHFDLRYLPALAPTLDLTRDVIAAYQRATGRWVQLARVLAWNVLTDLGDALWRTEAGIEVVGGPLPRRLEVLAARLTEAGLGWGGER